MVILLIGPHKGYIIIQKAFNKEQKPGGRLYEKVYIKRGSYTL